MFLIRTCFETDVAGSVLTKATPHPLFFVVPAPSQTDIANLDSAGILDEDAGPQAGFDRGASLAVGPDDDGAAGVPASFAPIDEVADIGRCPRRTKAGRRA